MFERAGTPGNPPAPPSPRRGRTIVVALPAVVIVLTLVAASLLAVRDRPQRDEKRPGSALVRSGTGARIPVPMVGDFSSDATAREETSAKTLLACGAGRLFWRAATGRVSAPVVGVESGAVRTIAGDFETAAAADRIYAQMSNLRRFTCYGDNIRRFMQEQANGAEITPTHIISGARVAGFEGKSRVYLMVTSTADGSVHSYVELAVLQRGRVVWIVAVSQLAIPPTKLLEAAVAAL